MQLRIFIPIVVLCVLAGCERASEQISEAIAEQFAKSGGRSVNLVQALPTEWDRVCVLGPYTTNEQANQTLGFSWNVEWNTSVTTQETRAAIVFVQAEHVVAYTEHPRNQGDFTNLSGQYFVRAEANFVQNSHPKSGWRGLFPAGAA